jgi:acyl-CoA reductase-like NAD-dependent aldehyde dehydrogenase
MSQASAPIRHADRFFIGGQWVAPSSDATIKVIDSDTEQVYFAVPEAQAADISRAVEAAREAFDNGPWPWLTHGQRAEYLRAIGAELERRSADIGQLWPRESGVLHAVARGGGKGAQVTFDRFAALADTFPFEEPAKPSAGQFGLIVREPVGVVGAIIPWNAPIGLISNKVAPALLAGCTVILSRASPAGRVHRYPEELTGGAGRGVPDRRGGRGHRPATGSAQRGHRRSRGLRAARARPPG